MWVSCCIYYFAIGFSLGGGGGVGGRGRWEGEG